MNQQETKTASDCQLERFGSAESDYLRICKKTSGQLVDFDKWNEGQYQRQLLHDQSVHIANQLESVGFRAYADRDIQMVGLFSKQALKLTSFRDIRLIPEVARRKRKPLLKDVEHFLSNHPKARMWVFTGGSRLGFDGLQDRIHTMHRKISKLNSSKLLKEYGIRFCLRATELGTIKREASDLVKIKGSEKVPTFHPHVHVLVTLDKYLDPVDWSVLLAKVTKFWGGSHWNDSGVMKGSARELVKYCGKPQELASLNAYELLTLQTISSSVRWYECLGDLRNERSERKRRSQRVDLVDGRWQVSNNWNQDNSPKHEPSEDETEEEQTLPAEESTSGPRTPLILARCMPAPIFSPTLEPCFLVEGLGDQSTDLITKSPQAEWLLSQIGWHDDINVHTTSLTVQENEPNEVQKSTEKVPKSHELLSPV
jgi:hypothetical protein